jgi:hypothetical protein
MARIHPVAREPRRIQAQRDVADKHRHAHHQQMLRGDGAVEAVDLDEPRHRPQSLQRHE